jgi:ribonuclease D
MKWVTRLYRSDLSQNIAAQFASASRLAWDIETSGLDPASDQIETVQIHSPEIGTALVQITGGARPPEICGLLESPGISKVFHHAMFDLRFMVSRWMVRPAGIQCTKVASKLLWPTRPGVGHTLKSLLAEQLGVSISKEQRLSDWSAHRLTSEQISYAAADVEYLLPLLDRLEGQLEDAGLSGDFRACLDFLPTRVRLDLGNWPDVFKY